MRNSSGCGGVLLALGGLILSIPADPVALHLVVERHAIDAEDASRLAHISPGVGEHRRDVSPLHVLQRTERPRPVAQGDSMRPLTLTETIELRMLLILTTHRTPR